MLKDDRKVEVNVYQVLSESLGAVNKSPENIGLGLGSSWKNTGKSSGDKLIL